MARFKNVTTGYNKSNKAQNPRSKPKMRVENVYTLAMWYSACKQQHAYLKAKKDPMASVFKELVLSYEERFKNLNEDIDVMAYFGEQNAA